MMILQGVKLMLAVNKIIRANLDISRSGLQFDSKVVCYVSICMVELGEMPEYKDYSILHKDVKAAVGLLVIK